MTEAFTIGNEELAILCDFVGGWGAKWATNLETDKRRALDRLMPMPRGKRAGSKTPTVDYAAGCLVRSTSTKCPTRKSRTSSSPPISRPESASGFKTPFQAILKELGKDVQIRFTRCTWLQNSGCAP